MNFTSTPIVELAAIVAEHLQRHEGALATIQLIYLGLFCCLDFSACADINTFCFLL